MLIVIVSWLLMICALVYQAIYVCRTGRPTLFFMKFTGSRASTRAPLGTFSRLAHALLYLFPAVAMTVILATALSKSGVNRVRSYLIGNLGMILWSLFFLLIGLLLVVQPQKMLRWTLRANPELEDKKSAVVITRLIGVGIVGVGAVILARL